MTTIHLIHGEPAAAALRQALQAHEAACPASVQTAARVIALADDLTVGPLRDIDEAANPGTALRAAFWQRVSGEYGAADERESGQALAQTLAQGDCAALMALEADNASVVIWHTHDAADQLTLRRACYRLRNVPQRLNEVRLTPADLAGTQDAAAVRLQGRLPDAAPISVLRITRLALEWQEAKFANGETRRWRDNTFTSGTWADLDAQILDILGQASPPSDSHAPWLACDTLGAALVRGGAGFTVGEPVVRWRLRELACAGELRLREDLCAARAANQDARSARPIAVHAAAHLSISR